MEDRGRRRRSGDGPRRRGRRGEGGRRGAEQYAASPAPPTRSVPKEVAEGRRVHELTLVAIERGCLLDMWGGN